MEEYLNIFIEDEIPYFINRYLETDTMKRIMGTTQFCGSDYTKIYSPSFLFTRYNHSLVVALMTWHFTHDRKETIKALLHDVGTPCFAHAIDYVYNDYEKQESSERKISDIVSKDKILLAYLEVDGIDIYELDDLSDCHILENEHPRLCVDRLDGVLHTVYIWLHTHELSDIKKIYDDLVVLKNEDGLPEIGFKSVDICLEFIECVEIYAKELQNNRSKYVSKYISEIVKIAVENNLISVDDLYKLSEDELVSIFKNNFKSWNLFSEATEVIGQDEDVEDHFSVSVSSKRRNTIPLVKIGDNAKRITEVSEKARLKYYCLDKYEDKKVGYIKELKKVE